MGTPNYWLRSVEIRAAAAAAAFVATGECNRLRELTKAVRGRYENLAHFVEWPALQDAWRADLQHLEALCAVS